MRTIHVSITEETHRDLKAMSEKTGHPVAAIARTAILRYIKDQTRREA